MAEQRKRLGLVLLKIGSKAKADRSVEVFDARDWPTHPEADAGLYRVRIGGRWIMDQNHTRTFFTAQGLAHLLTHEITTPGALDALDADMPQLRKGQPVSWCPSDFGTPSTRTYAGSDPTQCLDGQWRIIVCGRFVPCDEVQGLVLGREMPAPPAATDGMPCG